MLKVQKLIVYKHKSKSIGGYMTSDSQADLVQEIFNLPESFIIKSSILNISGRIEGFFNCLDIISEIYNPALLLGRIKTVSSSK